MRKIIMIIDCFIFFVLSSIANPQTCNGRIPYSRCSSNRACGCFPMADADKNVSVCAFLWKSCTLLVSCGPTQECSDANHICLHHSRCSSNPVCYPASMIKDNLCPPIVTSETSPMIPMHTTTMKLETTTKGLQFNKWKQNGTIVAGGNGKGDKLNQLSDPRNIFVDQNQNLLIADYWNDRIIRWKPNEEEGTVVAGGNGEGDRIGQLNWPTDMIVDEQNHSLIIADYGNRRVIRWTNQNQQEILILNVDCWDLTKDQFGFLYVSDIKKNRVRRWKIGEENKQGKLVAGGNGAGDQLNQLDLPEFIFVDSEQSVYVSDTGSDRVMKWRKDAKEGIVVAGGNGEGSNLNQLNGPFGITVDDLGRIYVADSNNHRIMRWNEGSREGEIIVGGNGFGEELNQLSYPSGLSFDVEGNLYVADKVNHRILRFDLILE